MAMYVHIADERDSAAIRRSGLKLPRARKAVTGRPWGVFAMPVIPNYVLSHQWVRELKKRGFRVAVGVYFRIGDEQPVFAGLYNQEKELTTASQAAAWLKDKEVLGFEVIIPRSISASEIRSIRSLPQGLGWRHFPGAHERGIFCGCDYCQRGEIKSRRIRERYEAGTL
jgi:hypothetical protein